MNQEDIQKALEAIGKSGINVAGDLVIEKNVEYEVNNVENGGIGIQIINGKEKPLAKSDKDIKDYLHNRNLVFVNVCRNMWLKTIEWLKIYTKRIGAHLVGHIVLQDKAPNLISAVTIVRWLICGKKEASHIMPRAGVSTKDIHDSRRFGEIIYQTLSLGDLQNLQSRLLSVGAIDYRPFILHIEKIGFRMFGFWAKYIKRKGDFRDVRRKNRVYAFYYYLIVALFIVSPIVELFYYITYPLQKNKKYKEEYCRI